MDPERWRKIEALYHAALAVEPDRRAAFLQENCAGDESLESEVESLLAHGENAGRFLEPPEAVKPPEAGQRVSHYEILEKLGEGGMGVVYKARDTRLGRSVALKFVKAQFSERFEREARAIAALNHPHIATLHDVGEHEGAPYLAMEFVEGKPLKGPRPVKEVIEHGIQIADALAAAHAAGIVHRDLKPANILVSEQGSVKILDFGLAKLRETGDGAHVTATLTGVSAGTPGYMSPEQIDGKRVDSRSDIFAFGCVLYELASGRHAFEGDSVGKVLGATATQEPKPLDGVPEGVERLIRYCLRKDPEHRLQHIDDARVLLEDLRDATPQPVRQVVRRPRPWPALVLAAIVLAALAAYLWLTRDDESMNLATYTHTPFATALTVQTYPAWSPDDRSIAFAGVVGGSLQLFVQRLDSFEPLQLTEPPLGGVFRPTWAPDSSELYFTATAGRVRGLWRVSSNGGESVLVQPDAVAGSISRDGRTLAFIRQTRDPRSLGVWVASPPDAKPQPYEPAPFRATGAISTPALQFAPDGKKILVAANPDGRGEEIWLLPWPAGRPRRVLTGVPLPYWTPRFCWMPDSRHILFNAWMGASYIGRIFQADIASGRFWPVAGESLNVDHPSVSPRGDRAVYVSVLGQYDVVEVPLDGSPVRPVLDSLRSEMMPAFARLGRTLVYVTNRRGSLEVWMKSLAEDRAWPLLSPSDFRLSSGSVSVFTAPAVSPDGRLVAVMAGNAVAGYQVWVTSTAGSAPVRITKERATEFAPTWSPDGQWIAYVRAFEGKRPLAKVRTGTSATPINLLEQVNTAVLPEWSPTGDWIACAVTDKPGITLVDPNTKQAKLLGSVSAPHVWSRDGRTLYQVRGTDNCSLWAIDVATGNERLIRELGELQPASPVGPGLRVTISPDGKSLAWSVNHARSELWILDGLRTPRPWFLRLLGMR